MVKGIDSTTLDGRHHDIKRGASELRKAQT